MGTETTYYCVLYDILHIHLVKLNNPLMGTETTCSMTITIGIADRRIS